MSVRRFSRIVRCRESTISNGFAFDRPLRYVYNKIDSISLEEVDRLARQPHTVVISCELDLNLEVLKKRIWTKMGFNRIYTKKRGERPDLGDPLVIKTDATIEAVVRFVSSFLFCYNEVRLEPLTSCCWREKQCNSIHKSLAEKFKYAVSLSLLSFHIPSPSPFSRYFLSLSISINPNSRICLTFHRNDYRSFGANLQNSVLNLKKLD